MSDKIRNEYTFGKGGSKTICTYCFFLTKGGVYGLEIRRISEDLGAPYKIELLFLSSTTNKNNHQLYQNDL